MIAICQSPLITFEPIWLPGFKMDRVEESWLEVKKLMLRIDMDKEAIGFESHRTSISIFELICSKQCTTEVTEHHFNR